MKVSTFFATLFAAGSAVAAPTAEAAAKQPTKFGIMSLRSASPIHFGQVSAAQRILLINLKDQHATCKGPSQNEATFYIKNEELFLYTPPNKPVQKVYVDRSGMGQGNVGYVTDKEMLPRYGETKGWKRDANNYLSFKGEGLLACPHSIQDAWRIWVYVGNAKPAGQEGCLGFSPLTVSLDKPVKCTYSTKANYS